MFAWLVDKKNEVRGYYSLIQKGDKCRDTNSRLEYPMSWVREDITPKQKMRFAEELREIEIESARFAGWKDSTFSRKQVNGWIKEIKERPWEEIIADHIKSVHDEEERRQMNLG